MSTDYPGNGTLPAEVKQRVVSTFQQTYDLYQQGLLDDVVVGCEFVLKMDPQFTPARKLLEKAKNPAAPIDVASLLPAGAPAPAPAGDPLLAAREAYAARDFQRAADLASGVLKTDMLNEEAQRLSEEARERLEADPFIQQFVAKARTQLAKGDRAAAQATLEKARALDEEHPALAELQSEIGAASTPAAPSYDPLSAFGVAPEEPAAAPPPSSFDFGSFTTPLSTPPPAAPSEGFVVDPAAKPAPAAPTPGDFGFTFEEDQSAQAGPDFASAFGAEEGPEITVGKTSPGLYGFTGGTAKEAAEAAAASSASTFDFSTASVDVSPDDQAKIDDFLRQGDELYAKGDFQGATDLWSRIFLIDVTNDQASERIERARAKKMEADRHTDELMSQGLAALERNDRATARRNFQRVLELDPSHTGAREQMEEIEAAEETAATAAAATAATAPAVPPPAKPAARAMPHPFDDDLFLDEPGGKPQAEILVPPDGAAPSLPADDDLEEPIAPIAARPRAGMPKGLIFGIVAIVVLLAGGFAAWKFMSGGTEETSAGLATLSQARQLADTGRIDQAISLLATVSPDDPIHDEAMAMVAELKGRKAQTVGMIDGRPAAEVHAELIDAGRAAAAASDWMGAKSAFEKAMAIQPLPADVRALYQDATSQVAKLENAINLFGSGNYARASAAAETILAAEPGNAGAKDLVVRSQFNLAVQALQQERLQDAATAFDRVLQLNPDDELARRGRQIVDRYEGKPKDLLYRIFVKYLKLR